MKKRLFQILLTILFTASAVHAAVVEYDLPHTFTMERLKDVPLMTIIDANNDGNRWAYTTHGEYTVMYILTDEKPADDWLILPAVKMKKSHVTRMRYTMRSGEESHMEAYEIKAGKLKSVEGMTIDVVTRTVFASAYYKVYEATIAVPEDGAYYIGFHAMSDAGCSAIVLDQVELEQGRPAAAPNPVTDLTVIPTSKGAYDAVISFTVPTTTGSGTALDVLDIQKIEILRDGILLTTLTGVEPGAQTTYTDRNIPNGDREYSVIVYGNDGESDAVKATTYIGYDVPYSPRNVNAVAQSDGVLLSWDAVGDEGTHYHYVDPARITYNIYQYDEDNGEFVLAGKTPAGATSYLYAIDTNEGPNQVLLFAIESADEQNGFVSGRRNESPRIIVGKPYDLPYDDKLDSNSPYSWFELEEPSGTTTNGWALGSTGGVNNRDVLYVKCAYPTSEADISSGKISVQGAVNPMLTFQYYLGSIAYNDRMEVIITRSDNLEPLTVAECGRYSVPASEWEVKSVDLRPYITPDTRWVTVRFKAYGAPALQEARDYQMLSSIRLMDVQDCDLSLSLLSASKEMKYNGAMNMNVRVQNLGSAVINPADYAVVLYKNGKRVSEAENVLIKPFSEVVLPLRYACCGPDEDDNLHFEARIECADDPVSDNNSVTADVTLVRPQLPQTDGLVASKNASGDIVLTWQKPQRTFEAVSEDFDSYEAFSIGEEVMDDYTIYFRPQETDYCGSGLYPHAGEPLGWLVFNSIKAGFVTTGAYAANSGEQCLVAFDGKDEMDTWLITPELSGNAQTITFYTSALTGNWGAELFNVYYSTKGCDKGDFLPLNSNPLQESDSWAWTKRSFDVPAGARYFAIQVVSTDKMGLKIDDLCFERVRGLDIDIQAYNVYVDGMLTASIPADSDPSVAIPLDHGAEVGVSIVTNWGEGPQRTLQIDPVVTSVNAVRSQSDSTEAYDVIGRRIHPEARGIVIRGGIKKF